MLGCFSSQIDSAVRLLTGLEGMDNDSQLEASAALLKRLP